MTYPLAHKIIKPRGDWTPAASTDIRKTFARHAEAQQMRQDAIDFMRALHSRKPLQTVRYDLTPEQRAEQEARIKEFDLPF